MGEGAHTQGEETLGPSEGFPYGARWRGIAWNDIALGLAVSAAMVLSLVGIAASLTGVSNPGLEVNASGTLVTYVYPGGWLWRDGVRAGAVILKTSDVAESSEAWVTLLGPNGQNTVSAALHDHALQASLPIGLVGLVVSALAFAVRAAWRRGAWAAGAAGAILGSVPLLLQGDPGVSTLASTASLVIPAAGLGVALSGERSRVRAGAILVLAVAVAALLAIWWFDRTSGVEDADRLESLRSSIAFWLTIGLLTLAVIDLRGLGAVRMPGRQSTPELALFAAIVASFAILAIYLHVPDVILFVVAAVLVLTYPRSRRALLGAADALFLGGVRRQAAIEASEGERARLAADLHDVPIQELSGVIARLELLPEAAGERDALRRIAAELRTMTSELRPPVLDDLGLPMALESLADQYAHDGTALRVDIADRTRPDDSRDPKVDLAIYRVTEEAVRNAMIHADAQRVDVTGVVAGDRVEIEVRDDGRGLDQRALERARRAGHAGLIAMRHRAEAIGARLSLRSELGGGVSVLLAWQR